jgi:hypothetical protein
MGYLKLCWLRLLIILNDLVNGVYSGFPICCILYYIRIHCGGLRLPGHYSRHHLLDNVQCGYVRCPACVHDNYYVKHIRKGNVYFIKCNYSYVYENYPLEQSKKEYCYNCNILLYKLLAKGQYYCKCCEIVSIE